MGVVDLVIGRSEQLVTRCSLSPELPLLFETPVFP
jgi:hypothetical protein